MKGAGAIAAALALATGVGHAQAPRRLDGFDVVGRWTAYASDGVEASIHADHGTLRADVDYHGGAGYAVLHRPLPLTLPANYVFRFKVRGTLPRNNLEFKLLDSTGQNVWWSVRRNFRFGPGWTEVLIPRREISFAWGPLGGGAMRQVAALEIAFSAGEGGKGSVWLDSLTFAVRPPVDTTWPILPATVVATPGAPDAARAADGDSMTSWAVPGRRATDLTFTFGTLRGFGAVRLMWDGGAPSFYSLLVSGDGRRWQTVDSVRDSDGGRDYLFTGPQETRLVRLHMAGDSSSVAARLREVTFLPLAFGTDSNRVITQMALDAAPGLFPRSFGDSLAFWTIVGADGDTKEALVEESGRVEVDEGGFSIEPFLRIGDSLVTWHDVLLHDSLTAGDLPIPVVTWQHAPVELETTAWTAGRRDSSSLLVSYRLSNRGSAPIAAELLLAVRPLQVNPPSQFLNAPGGIGHVSHLALHGDTLIIDAARVVFLNRPDSGGVTTFDHGDVSSYLARGVVPAAREVTDPRHLASGVLSYHVALAPGQSRTVTIAAPWHGIGTLPAGADPAWAAASRARDAADWRSRTSGFALRGSLMVGMLDQTIRASVAYILINRDGAAIQPGSRAYARSWIRDAALTSSALLRLGITDPVREFLEWFAPYQFASGKVPCCVDRRGADPVPENDSEGEFIYLATEYARRTGDTVLLRRLWPRVAAAVTYMDSLRHSRMISPWRDSLGGAFYGLMPESISHEGYSAHPEHSYWDDFWAARGFADAASGARQLGLADSLKWQAVADSFRHDLLASIRQAMAVHHIDFIPGSVELADFDATSTTIAGDPAELLDSLPPAAVHRTFEKFDSVLQARRSGQPWTAYTPYEARAVGTKVRLGWRESALEQLKDLLADQRPPAWRQWPEVVRRNARAPEFLGDLPHTWVASDFIRAALDLFVYEAPDGSLVLMGGIDQEWLHGTGVDARIPWSSHGAVEYSARFEGDTLAVQVRSAPGNAAYVLLRPPMEGRFRATADGRPLAVTPEGIRLDRVPADVRITSRPE
jgi:hypothetical protein